MEKWSSSPPVLLESKPLKIPEEFESRRLTEDNIIAALKDENINTIAICGIGGIGKTRMARRIGEKMKGEKQFKFVVMVRVGPSSNFKRVAYEISNCLGLRLEGKDFVATSDGLVSRLNMEETVLMILDDVLEIFYLEKIVMLLQKHNKSCKILMTSRYKSICLAMGAHKIFTVGGLTRDEMWILAREEVGNSVDPLAYFIAEKCRGLQVTLNFVKRLLKDRSKHWRGIGIKGTNPTPALWSLLLQETVGESSSFEEAEVAGVLEAQAPLFHSQIHYLLFSSNYNN